MGLYFYHLRNGEDLLLDPDGRQTEEHDIVRVALTEARSIISDDALSGRLQLNQHIAVEDALGRIVHVIRFEDAVELIGPDRE